MQTNHERAHDFASAAEQSMNPMDAVEVTIELASPSMNDAEKMELILWGAVLRNEHAEPFTWAYKYTALRDVATKIDSFLTLA